MSERLSQKYRQLFEVRVLHHYWLDDGATLFDKLSDPVLKQRRLVDYDVSGFLEFVPTAPTRAVLDAYRAVCAETSLGLLVAVPEGTKMADEDCFEFAVKIKNFEFFNYTALTLMPQRIFDGYDSASDRYHRFKENVPVLSNLTGTVRGNGADAVLYLSKDYSALTAEAGVEALVQSGTALLQLISDQPAAAIQTLTPQADQFPVFLHQGDIPQLVPIPGIAGLPARGIELTDAFPDSLFALIRLFAVNPSNEAFSLIDNGQIKMDPPVFEIRLKNRSTFWRYIDRNTGSTESEEPAPLPLTFFGNAGSKRKPSEIQVKAVFDGLKIDKLVSEVFV